MTQHLNNSVLITGCAGFIGSHAVDYFLSMGNSVIGVDSLTYAGNLKNLNDSLSSNSFKFFKEDICNTAAMREICDKHDVEWIFNFAAETHVDNSIDSDLPFFHSNILGVRSLLNVCKDLDIKIFHISTDEVYGSTVHGSFHENDSLSPQNPYSATKAAAEHVVNAYSNP